MAKSCLTLEVHDVTLEVTHDVTLEVTPGFPVHHELQEFTQTHAHRVGDAIQPCHPLPFPFSSCPQSFPASGSFPMSQLFTSGGQSIRASTSASVFPGNIQGWFPLGLTDLISLLSKGLSRVFPSTTIQKYQFFSSQPSFMVQLSHSYMTTGKTTPLTDCMDLCQPSDIFAF